MAHDGGSGGGGTAVGLMDILVQCGEKIVREKLAKAASEGVVTGDNSMLGPFLKALEGVLEAGVWEGSHWWEGWNLALDVMATEANGVPEGLTSTLGDTQQTARWWIITALQHIASFEEFLVRLRGLGDINAAYFTEGSFMSTPAAYEKLLKLFSRLTSITFRLKPRDARLFEPVELASPPLSGRDRSVAGSPVGPRGNPTPGGGGRAVYSPTRPPAVAVSRAGADPEDTTGTDSGAGASSPHSPLSFSSGGGDGGPREVAGPGVFMSTAAPSPPPRFASRKQAPPPEVLLDFGEDADLVGSAQASPHEIASSSSRVDSPSPEPTSAAAPRTPEHAKLAASTSAASPVITPPARATPEIVEPAAARGEMLVLSPSPSSSSNGGLRQVRRRRAVTRKGTGGATSGSSTRAPGKPSTATQTDATVDRTAADIDAQLRALQKNEVTLLERRVDLGNREQKLKKRERVVAEASDRAQNLVAAVELLANLSQHVVGMPAFKPGELQYADVCSRMDDIIDALRGSKPSPAPGVLLGPPSPVSEGVDASWAGSASIADSMITAPSTQGAPNVASPAVSVASSLITPTMAAAAAGSHRARSGAVAPVSNQAAVMTGGTTAATAVADALSAIQEDFFTAPAEDVSDDDQLQPVGFNDSFLRVRSNSNAQNVAWVNFEGYDVEEKGSVNKANQLAAQNYECVGCGASLKAKTMLSRGPRACEYSGRYFCTKCHANKTHVIPALIVHRWDFTPRKVCNPAHWHLRKIHHQPELRLSDINPVLYTRVPAMQKSQRYRQALVELTALFKTHEPHTILGTLLGSHQKEFEYYFTDDDVYSLRDLVALGEKENEYFATLRELIEMIVRRVERHEAETPVEIMQRYGVVL